ncbi:tetratricopeptide repeat protein [Coraliomargarita akajimensis]|uniref:tetratricopeptide repeat protein n=1 Tax=Coraliomargarita akajimensis TaxID=395922 RepID=UPI00145E41E1|nr:tetratricopeptide repeat protein [Coraliomargarita akajimensis]
MNTILLVQMLCCLVASHIGCVVHAGEVRDLSDQQLRSRLGNPESGSLAGKIDLLTELCLRAQDTAQSERYQFLLGVAWQDTYLESRKPAALRKACEVYRRYLEAYPDSVRLDFVHLNLAMCYVELSEFDAAIPHYTWLVQYSQTGAVQRRSLERLCRLYIDSEQPEAGLHWYREVFEQSILDPERRTMAAVWMVQGLLAAGKLDEIPLYRPYLLGQSAPLFEPQFNVALMEGADRLMDQACFAEAMLLLSFVRPKAVLEEFWRAELGRMQRRIKTLSEDSSTGQDAREQLARVQGFCDAVAQMPDYDLALDWRRARAYQETGRDWEALWAFYELFNNYPNHESAEDFLWTAYSLAEGFDDPVLIPELARLYLDLGQGTRYRQLVWTGWGQHLLNAEDPEAQRQLLLDCLRTQCDSSSAAYLIHQRAAYFMQRAHYRSVRDCTQDMDTELEGQLLAGIAADYWSAIGRLMLADYESAEIGFRDLLSSTERQLNTLWDDTFFRHAVSLFGLQQFDRAASVFKEFIERNPESVLAVEATVYLGDISRLFGDLETALGYYGPVCQRSEHPRLQARAVFASAEIYQEQADLEAAFNRLFEFVTGGPAAAYKAEALARMGDVRQAQGRLLDRYRLHRNVFEAFANDPDASAVDDVLARYLVDHVQLMKELDHSVRLLERLSREPDFRHSFLADRAYQYRFLQSEEGNSIVALLRDQLVYDRPQRARLIVSDQQTEDAVQVELGRLLQVYRELQDELRHYAPLAFWQERYQVASAGSCAYLRARMALSLLAVVPLEELLGGDALSAAPDAVVLWEAHCAEGVDVESARTLYRFIVERDPLSDGAYQSLRAQFRLAVEQAEESNDALDWQAARRVMERLEEGFAARDQGVEYRLQQAALYEALDEWDAAVAVYHEIVQRPEWRGQIHAQAHLQLGRLYLQRERWAEAHAFFERLMVAYSGFDEELAWAYYYDLTALSKMGKRESMDALLAEYGRLEEQLKSTEASERMREVYAF